MSNILNDSIAFAHNHIMFLNNSKFFAGIVMILLNIGSKFLSIQFSKSTEEYLKMVRPNCCQNSCRHCPGGYKKTL